MDDIDMITDEISNIKAHTRKHNGKRIKVRGTLDVARDDYRKARRLHRNNIKGLRTSIKAHKLMIKQARTTYKIIKMKG